jgi:hypothetical protein
MNEDIKHYYLNVVNGIVTNIDLIYSPDEDGYYLEKFVYDQLPSLKYIKINLDY